MKKIYLLASLGLLIPILLISIAFVAIKSDQKNKEKYDRQQEEILKRIYDKEQAEQKNSLKND